MLIIKFLSEIWSILMELAPWLFLGTLIATILKFALPADFISRHLGRPTLGSVVKSSFLGLPMPLCSCGVIPAAVGLKKSGASNGAVISFLISTPQTGMDSLLIVASFLGWPLALFMMVTTFVTGILGGTLVHFLAPQDKGIEDQADSAEATCSLSNEAPVSNWRKYYRYAVEELIGGIYRYLVIGVLVAAVINLAVPANSLAGIPMLQGMFGLVGVLAVAIPLYVCTNGSVPIAASLVASGLPAGAALVFLMAGSATNIATIGSVRRILGQRIMLIYLATIIFSSLGLALLFQSLWGDITVAHVAVHRHQAGSSFMHLASLASAMVLAALILHWSFQDLRIWLRKNLRPLNPADQEMLVLQVDGMTCTNCAARIQRDLELVPGVTRVEVNLETGLTRMWGRALNRERLVQAVCQAGYTVQGTTCPGRP